VSADLKPLIRDVYDEVRRVPTDRPSLKAALAHLLSFLAGPVGRTDANCRTTDLFFCLNENYPFRHLPRDFQAIMADIGGALHDTMASPHIAKNFESLPEQLLQRVQALEERAV
jgi:hypothetical protein